MDIRVIKTANGWVVVFLEPVLGVRQIGPFINHKTACIKAEKLLHRQAKQKS